MRRPKDVPRPFLLRRNIYRNFSTYFKDLFAKYNKKYLNLKCSKEQKTAKMEDYIDQFIDEYFDDCFEMLSDDIKSEAKNAVKQVLFSHRYQKGDDFTQGIDFTDIRNVMYQYSYEARDKLFSSPYICYLFSYYIKHHGKKFIKQQSKNKSIALKEELEKEMSEIQAFIENSKFKCC
jgi:hypothetical protein